MPGALEVTKGTQILREVCAAVACGEAIYAIGGRPHGNGVTLLLNRSREFFEFLRRTADYLGRGVDGPLGSARTTVVPRMLQATCACDLTHIGCSEGRVLLPCKECLDSGAGQIANCCVISPAEASVLA